MKKFLLILMAFLLAGLLTACGEYSAPLVTDGTGDDVSTSEPTPEIPAGDREFRVSLSYNGALYLPEEDITVQWTDGYSVYTAELDDSGYATVKGLDGDYQVTLTAIPKGFSYNPNVNIATNDKPDITVELYKLGTTTGSGSDLYNNIINLTGPNVYRTELKNDEQIVYYQFVPRYSGTYTIESWVDTTAMKLNPQLDVYNGTFAAKFFAYTMDEGGAADGFTKNFLYTVEIGEEQIGNVFAFGVKVKARGQNAFPCYVDFAVQLNGSFVLDHIKSEMVVPEDLCHTMIKEIKKLQAMSFEEIYALPLMRASNVPFNVDEPFYQATLEKQYQYLKAINFDVDESKDPIEEEARLFRLFAAFWNNPQSLYGEDEDRLSCFRNYLRNIYNGSGSFVGAETMSKGRWIFDGTQYALNEKTGFYHLYNPKKFTLSSTLAVDRAYAEKYGEGFGPILYASVSSACRFLDQPFSMVEYIGNKALTVANGKENHKHFIEGWKAMVGGMAGQPGAYCGIDCTGCYKDLEGNLIGSCSANGHACLAGCSTCTRSCNPCRAELMYMPGYADLCNIDGRFPVTPELKEFLQKYSVSQLLFFDGNGWVEENPDVKVDAQEDDQWLFACGYYLG